MPSRLLLIFVAWLTLVLPSVGQSPLPTELQARLLSARAVAAVHASDPEGAVAPLQEATRLAPWVVGAEKLFRLQLMRGDLRAARQVLVDYDERPGVEELLLAVLEARASGKHPPKELLLIESTEPPGLLYTGLLHSYAGDIKEAKERLLLFLESGEWGRPLATEVLLRTNSELCRMCREKQAVTFYQAYPVCHTCQTRLSDPDWIAMLIYKPDPESLRLMKSLSGEDFPSDLGASLDASLPESLRTRAALSPVLGLPELVESLSPQARKIWERAGVLAKERGRALVGRGELGMALFEGDFDDRFFGTAAEQKLAYEEARALPEETGEQMAWVLNQANWFHTLAPEVSAEGIQQEHLVMAWDLSVGDKVRSWLSVPLTFMVAHKMGRQQHELFERLSAERPNSLFLHLVLANRASGADFLKLDQQSRLAHELWLIEHHPGLRFRHSGLQIPEEDPAGFRRVVDAWARAVEAHPTETDVLAGASSFFTLSDLPLAIALNERCQALEPEEGRWAKQAVHLYDLAGDDEASGEEAHRQATRELQLAEQALAKAPSEAKGPLLTELAVSALEAGAYERAREVAEELLREHCKDGDWNAGNAKHKAHSVLGLLAMNEGDKESAKRHLLESARSKGSPQMNSFGPNMRLAQALLLADEKDAVLAYFKLCASFWKDPSLAQWEAEVQQGIVPDFGPNLEY